VLPDRSFYSSVKTPYRFIDVTDQIGSEADRKRYEELRGQEYYDVPAQAELPAGVKAP
jgi:hypothetical protein